MQIDLDHNLTQIKDLTTKLSQMNLKFTETCAQHESIVQEITEEKEKVESKLYLAQRKESELLQSLKKANSETYHVQVQLQDRQQQLEQLSLEFDKVAESFLAKKQQYKQQIANLKAS